MAEADNSVNFLITQDADGSILIAADRSGYFFVPDAAAASDPSGTIVA
jgi:hypothetical protein